MTMVAGIFECTNSSGDEYTFVRVWNRNTGKEVRFIGKDIQRHDQSAGKRALLDAGYKFVWSDWHNLLASDWRPIVNVLNRCVIMEVTPPVDFDREHLNDSYHKVPESILRAFGFKRAS